MPKPQLILTLLAMLLCCVPTFAQQSDSTLASLQEIPQKYISTIDKKIDRYSARINSKTERTLQKLVKWEEKIKRVLEKTNPDLAKRLFGNSQLTFSSMLQKYKSGEMIAKQYQKKYDYYIDKVSINLKYLDSQKTNLNTNLLKPFALTKAKLDSLSGKTENIEALQQAIKERKRELVDAAFRVLGKNKYLSKINKEAWYYAETIRNYKAIFNNPEKTEKAIKDVLGQIPLFKDFANRNSQLASIFGLPAGSAATGNNQPVMGLQPSAGVQNAIRTSLGNNTNVSQLIQQNVQQAQAEINRLKNELIRKGGSGNELAMPDFKPNMQKTKLFWQRIEYQFNVQFAKNNTLMPTTADIALGAGYKIDDKRLIGFAISYRLGMGSIENIKLSHQGMGLRSYVDWKFKRQFFISGGFEMNYNSPFDGIAPLKEAKGWQQAALLGLSKKIGVRTKFFKATKFQLLYDFLARQHVPVSQPVLFRVGYSF